MNNEQSKLDAELQKPKMVKDRATCVATSNEKILAIPNYASADLQELDEKVKSMMELSQNRIKGGRRAKICKMCGKEGERKSIRDHIEANHMEGHSLPCHICGKISRSRKGLRNHKSYMH